MHTEAVITRLRVREGASRGGKPSVTYCQLSIYTALRICGHASTTGLDLTNLGQAVLRIYYQQQSAAKWTHVNNLCYS